MPTVPNYNINSTAETSINTAKRRITGLNKVQTNELTESVPGNQMTEDQVDDMLYKITSKINFDVIVELKKLKSYLQIANVDEKGRDPASLREFVSSSAKIEPNVREILSVLKKLYKSNNYNYASLGVFTDFLTAVDEAISLVREIKPISIEFEKKVLRDNPALAGMITEMEDTNYKEAYLTGAVQVGKTHWNELFQLANDLQANRPISRRTYNRILDGVATNIGFVPPSAGGMSGGNWLNNIASAAEIFYNPFALGNHIEKMVTDTDYRKGVDQAWRDTVWNAPGNLVTSLFTPRPKQPPRENPLTDAAKNLVNWSGKQIETAVDDWDTQGGSIFSLFEDPVSRMIREGMSGKEISAFKPNKTSTLKKSIFGGGLTPQETRQLNQLRELMKDIDPNQPSSSIQRKIAELEAKESGTSGTSGTSAAEATALARGIVNNIMEKIPAEQRSETSTKEQKSAATKNMKRLAEALRKSGIEKQRIIAATKDTDEALKEALDDFENVIAGQPELRGLSTAAVQDIVAKLFLEAYGAVDTEMMGEIAQEALDESAPAPDLTPELEPDPEPEPEVEEIEREPSTPRAPTESSGIDSEIIDEITEGRPFDPSIIDYLADKMTDDSYWRPLLEDSDGDPTIELDEQDRKEAFKFVTQLLEAIKENEDDAREAAERNKKNKLFKYAKEIINLMPSKVKTITKLIESLQEATKVMVSSFNTRRKQYALSDAGIEERVKQGGSMYDRSFNENNLKLYNSSGLPKYI